MRTFIHMTWPTGDAGDALAAAVVEGLAQRGELVIYGPGGRGHQITAEVIADTHEALNNAAVGLIREVEEAGGSVGNWSALQFLVKPVR